MLTYLELFCGLLISGSSYWLMDSDPLLGCAVLLLGGFITLAGIDRLCGMNAGPDVHKACSDENS